MRNVLKYLIFTLFVCFYSFASAQLQLNIPTGNALSVTFGKGVSIPGLPLNQGRTDFQYTTNLQPDAGFYTVDTANLPKVFLLFTPYIYDDSNYAMHVNAAPSPTPRNLFIDTVSNICGGQPYIFWTTINPDVISTGSCFYPNFEMSAQTVSGKVLGTFQTGDIGGPTDNRLLYPGYYSTEKYKSEFFGFTFDLPPSESKVIVKITENPSTASVTCRTTFRVDNIFVSAIGPSLEIASQINPDYFLPSSCSTDTLPFVFNATIDNGYLQFGTNNYIPANFKNPKIVWQHSDDNGFTWKDYPFQSGSSFSNLFSTPDTFYIRARVSESDDINNMACSVTSNVLQMHVDAPPTKYSFTSNSPVCEDSDIVFNLSGGAKYVTQGPNNFLDSSAFPHIYHPSLNDSGLYIAKIISLGGCYAFDSVDVKVIGPNLSVTASADSICYGSNVQLTATGGSNYLWTPSDFLNNASVFNPVASPLRTTTYQVKSTDDFGCSATKSLTIKLLDTLLQAGINSDNIFCPTDVPVFKDSSIGKIKSWFWSFGNAETSQLQNPSSPHYNFSANHNYPVQLIVQDSAGCSDTTFKTVKTVMNCYIAVPQAFTPNGDGLNDYLYPLNAYKASNLLFQVYNRFGKRIFVSTDWTKKWDGKVNSIPQQTGTYVWMLDYTDENNNPIHLQGTTVLIR